MNVCPNEVYQNGKTKSFRVQGDIHKGVRNIYSVILFPKGWSCECVDWLRKMPKNPDYECKHIQAVKQYIKGVKNDDDGKEN